MPPGTPPVEPRSARAPFAGAVSPQTTAAQARPRVPVPTAAEESAVPVADVLTRADPGPRPSALARLNLRLTAP